MHAGDGSILDIALLPVKAQAFLTDLFPEKGIPTVARDIRFVNDSLPRWWYSEVDRLCAYIIRFLSSRTPIQPLIFFYIQQQQFMEESAQ
jgi:hypothetical protein